MSNRIGMITEEQYADNVAYRIYRAEQDHHAVVKYLIPVQQSDKSITADPQQCHEHHTVVVFYDDVCIAGLDVILLEMLLAARAFQRVREETEGHLNDEHNEDDDYRDLFYY